MTVVLLNPNTSDATTAAMVEIAGASGTGLAFAGRTAPFGSAMIVDAAGLAEGARAVAAMAAELAADPSATGAIVSAFGDPGIEAARARLALPVVGIGEAGILDAAAGGRRFAVATTTPGLVSAIASRVADLGLDATFAGTFLTRGDPAVVTADPVGLVEALAGAVEAAIAEGAEAVVIGGGPLARAAMDLRGRFGVPLIEPVPAAARRMAALLAGSGVRG